MNPIFSKSTTHIGVQNWNRGIHRFLSQWDIGPKLVFGGENWGLRDDFWKTEYAWIELKLKFIINYDTSGSLLYKVFWFPIEFFDFTW